MSTAGERDAKRLSRCGRIFRAVEHIDTINQIAAALRKAEERIRARIARQRETPSGRTGRPRRQVDDRTYLAIWRAISRGESARAIARKLGIPRSTLSLIIKRDRLLIETAANRALRNPSGGAWGRRKAAKALRAQGVAPSWEIERRRSDLLDRQRRARGWTEWIERELAALDVPAGKVVDLELARDRLATRRRVARRNDPAK